MPRKLIQLNYKANNHRCLLLLVKYKYRSPSKSLNSLVQIINPSITWHTPESKLFETLSYVQFFLHRMGFHCAEYEYANHIQDHTVTDKRKFNSQTKIASHTWSHLDLFAQKENVKMVNRDYTHFYKFKIWLQEQVNLEAHLGLFDLTAF